MSLLIEIHDTLDESLIIEDFKNINKSVSDVLSYNPIITEEFVKKM